jgi:hypothetical protein
MTPTLEAPTAAKTAKTSKVYRISEGRGFNPAPPAAANAKSRRRLLNQAAKPAKPVAHITFDAICLDSRWMTDQYTNLPRWEVALWSCDPIADSDEAQADGPIYIQSIDLPTQDEIDAAEYTYHGALIECQHRRNELVADMIDQARLRGYGTVINHLHDADEAEGSILEAVNL